MGEIDYLATTLKLHDKKPRFCLRVGFRRDVVAWPFILGPRLVSPFMDFAVPLALPLAELFTCSMSELVRSAPGFVA